METGRTLLLDVRDPERVTASGIDFGGPLKIHHVAGGESWSKRVRHFVVKWPSYSQWSGVGCREANPTEYWLCRAVRHDPSGTNALTDTTWSRPGWVEAKVLKRIEPGRKRKLTQALVAECDATLRVIDEEGGNDEGCREVQGDRREDVGGVRGGRLRHTRVRRRAGGGDRRVVGVA